MPSSRGDRERDRRVEAVLREHYFRSCPEGYLETEVGRNDLQNHVWCRLRQDREIVIPWLEEIRPLKGISVLEIGCGTGSSTVALAERGAEVTAVDLDEPSLVVARERCRAHGVGATFVTANGASLPTSVQSRPFDIVIFYASLEHMTIDERFDSIKTTWEMLPVGGLWSIIETPNRLWYFDFHTSLLPFFLWLPDEVAFAYAKFSDRPRFKEIYRDLTPEALLHFRRRGRGVSFHELELVLGKLGSLEVAGWLDWTRRTTPWHRRLRRTFSADVQYARALKRIAAGVNAAFLQPRIDVVIRKTGREVC